MLNDAKNFELELNQLINSCGLTVSEAYYIVENAALQLKLLYLETAYQHQGEPQDSVHTYKMEVPNEVVPGEITTVNAVVKEE